MEPTERRSGEDRRKNDRRKYDRREEDKLPSYEKLAFQLKCSHNEVKKLTDEIRDLNNKHFNS